MNKILFLFCLSIALLTGCTPERPAVTEKDHGRESTKPLEGASAVGYDGKAVRKSVDGALDRSEEHVRAVDGEIKKDNDGQPKN